MLTGLLACKPNRLCPGWTAVNRLAVDKAKAGRLKALAVLAFCAEMTRLPGHWSPGVSPERVTMTTTPERSTIVAHMFKPKPPFSSLTTLLRASLTWAWLGIPSVWACMPPWW